MDPSSNQGTLDWTHGSTSSVRDEGRPLETAQQSYIGHMTALPDNASVHEASQSPIYMPPSSQITSSREHPQNTMLPTNPFYSQFAISQARPTHSMPNQQPYYPQQAQVPGYFSPPTSQSTPAQPQAPPQQPFYEGMSNFMPPLFTPQYRYSSARTSETSSSSSQIVMRKRRAPYPTPPGLKDSEKGARNRLDQQRRGQGVARPSLQTQALPKQEPSYHDEINAPLHSSMSATQAMLINEPSPIEPRHSSTSGLVIPAASERAPYTPHAGWNEEVRVLKHEQAAGGVEDSSSASQLSPIPSLVGPNQPPTVFIHSNVPRASQAATNAAEDYEQYRNFFPDNTEQHRQLRIAMHDVMNSEWKLRNELEPTSGDLLQFSSKIVSRDGATSFRCLMWHQGKECDKTWNRAERILAHLRGMIDLRPFACEGNEADDACNCAQRFYAEDTLQQHKKNLKTIECEYCGSCITPRNKRRHLRHNCAKSPERAQ